MLYNYRLLGTWPLAVTAYNHGPGGLRRAQERIGHERHRRHRQALSGRDLRLRLAQFLCGVPGGARSGSQCGEVFRPDHAACRTPRTRRWNCPTTSPSTTLAKAFNVDMGALQGLESGAAAADLERRAAGAARLRAAPSRRPPQAEIAAAWARLPPSAALSGPAQRRQHIGFAAARPWPASRPRAASSVARLLAANGWSSAHAIARGDIVRIPMPASRAERRRRRRRPPCAPSCGGAASQPGAALAPRPRCRASRRARCGRPDDRRCRRPRSRFRATNRQRGSAAGRSADGQLGCDATTASGRRHRHRAGGRNAGALRRLDRSRFADAACPQQAAQERAW